MYEIMYNRTYITYMDFFGFAVSQFTTDISIYVFTYICIMYVIKYSYIHTYIRIDMYVCTFVHTAYAQISEERHTRLRVLLCRTALAITTHFCVRLYVCSSLYSLACSLDGIIFILLVARSTLPLNSSQSHLFLAS